jgi:sec-independent protein translocase protein TatB
MFDIGFAELLIIALVSLIVIGPERLPETVRTVSAWINRFRRSFNEIKRDVQLELHNDAVLRDLKQTGSEVHSQFRELQDLGRLDASEAPPVRAAQQPENAQGEHPTPPPPASTPAPEQPSTTAAQGPAAARGRQDDGGAD